MHRLLALSFILLLAACSRTASVQGAIADGSETFSGETTGYSDGSGTLSITSNRGRRCQGQWVLTTSRMGAGTFTCSDSQGGPFEFVTTGKHGTGTGTLGGKRFTFTFG